MRREIVSTMYNNPTSRLNLGCMVGKYARFPLLSLVSGVGLPYKSEFEYDARRLAKVCRVQIRFWSHLRYLGRKVTIFAHSGIA